MTKNEFKIGDRVRFTGDYHHYAESTLEVGKEYTVVSADEYGCDLSVQCTAYSVDAEDLELVEPLDRKTAFLRELQALMRKYDAEICGGLSDISEEDVVFILVDNKDKVKYLNGTSDTYAHITADNIMDFDKE